MAKNIFFMIVSLFKSQSALVVENLALRQQLSIYRNSKKRPKIRLSDRLFWILISKCWTKWKDALIVVKPETVIGWHRKGFKLFWAWKSRKKRPGRPRIPLEIRNLIKQMAKGNPNWGAPRIHGEISALGIAIDETTVSNYLKRFRPIKPPSQTWRSFLENHMHNTYAIDFFIVPTATFRVLYVFIVLWHETRNLVHFNVTEDPNAKKHVHGRRLPNTCSGIGMEYMGRSFKTGLKEWESRKLKQRPRSPWQNPFCERAIGSVRRGCLDHLIVLNVSSPSILNIIIMTAHTWAWIKTPPIIAQLR